jgi:hypothetical protein
MAGNEPNWLVRLERGVRAHIQVVQQKRDELAAQARPPQAVLDVALADPEAVKLGEGLNKEYKPLYTWGRKVNTSTC